MVIDSVIESWREANDVEIPKPPLRHSLIEDYNDYNEDDYGGFGRRGLPNLIEDDYNRCVSFGVDLLCYGSCGTIIGFFLFMATDNYYFLGIPFGIAALGTFFIALGASFEN